MAIFNQPSAPKRDIPAPPEPPKPTETALSASRIRNEFISVHRAAARVARRARPTAPMARSR